jgi:PAS domain S-box-containing protein
MDNSSEGILVADTQGNFLEANKKMRELLGYTKAELLTSNINQIHPAEELARTSAAFQEILQRGSGGLDGGWVRRKDGKTIPVDITGSKVECGDETLIQEIFKDIRERQKAEAERLRFSKLESLGILAGGIAHDFNNILTAILGNIGLALLEGKMEGQLLERLSQAEQACLQAQGLARQLLTFAKGGAPIKKATSLPELCRESANLALAGSKARCEFSLPEDLWPVEVDAGQIHLVINNLLINADQAMPEGGRIKVQAENVLLAQKSALPLPPGKYVKLTIADQGIGIASKYLDKIFDPYFTTKQKGSGLGLATAYSIIKNHSGYLSVESEVGVGTTFEIYLHALEGKPAVKKKEIEKPLRGQGRILVMDDEEIVLEVLSRALTFLGYEVDLTKDGGQAIDKYAQAKESGRVYDGVILDLTVPGGMGGKETIEKLLKIDPQVKAIVSSGYSDDPILGNFEDYGFSGVITKPYKVSELSKILHEVIINT